MVGIGTTMCMCTYGDAIQGVLGLVGPRIGA